MKQLGMMANWLFVKLDNLAFPVIVMLTALAGSSNLSSQTTYPGQIGAEASDRPTGFIDAFKDQGRLMQNSSGNPVPTDANGNPLSDGILVVFDGRPFPAWAPPIDDPAQYQPEADGTYTISFTGQATLANVAGDPVLVFSNQTYDPVHNVTTANVYLPGGPTYADGPALMVISFTNTQLTPSSPANSGIANFQCIRPGWTLAQAANPSQVFDPAFVAAFAPFGYMRYMNWLGTNTNPFIAYTCASAAPACSAVNTPTIGWSQRSLPTDFYQGVGGNSNTKTGAWGISWEYVILLANASNKDVWINVPINATGSPDPLDPAYVASPDTSSYVYNLAMLFKNGDAFTGNAGLNPGLHIYIEDSNEVWNSAFLQYGWNESAAEAEVAQGSSVLNNDGNTNTLTWAYRRHIKRVYEIAGIFESVYGTGSFGNIIRPVYAWWQLDEGSGSNAAAALSWFKNTYGPPANYIYGMALAVYYSPTNWATDTTIPEVLSDMTANSNASVTYTTGAKTLANQYGLQLFSYEGGPGNTNGGANSTTNVGVQIQANRDPGMDTLLQTHIRNNWFANGGNMFGLFVFSSAYSRYGDWGATDDYRNLTTAKYNAIINLTGYTSNGVPVAPGALVASGGLGAVSLVWQPVPGAANYNVYRGLASGTETLLATISSASFNDTAVTNGTTYYYYVAGVNSFGVGAPSNEAYATPESSAPPVPTLSTSPGNGQATLTWTPAAGAVSYNVYEGTTPGGEGATPIATGITNTSYLAGGLTNGQPYYFEVAGVNIIGTGSPSNESMVTPVGPPPAPTGLAGTIQDSETVLTWTASFGATSYSVYEGTNGSGSEGSTPIATGITALTYTVTGLTDGTPYFFTVQAANANGNSNSSNEIEITPSNPNTLIAYEPFGEAVGPITTGCCGSSTGEGNVGGDVGWNNSVWGINGSNGSPGYDIAATTPMTYTGLNTTGQYLTGGYSYETVGRFLDTTSTGAFASYLYTGSLYTNAIGAPGTTLWMSLLMQVAGLGDQVAVFPTPNCSNLQWYDCDNTIGIGYMGSLSETGGKGYWSLQYNTNTNNIGTGTVIQTTSQVTLNTPALLVLEESFTTTGGTVNLYVNPTSLGGSAPATPSATWTTTTPDYLAFNGITYYGGSGTGNSQIADLRIGTSFAAVTPLPRPPAPTGLTAAAGNGQATLNWNAASGASSYNIYQGTASGGENGTPIATGVTGTSYTVTGLTNGTPYFFEVAGVNAVGAGSNSNEAEVIPGSPAAPTGLAAAVENASIGLTWNSMVSVTSYQVWYETTTGGTWTEATSSDATNSYTVTGLTNGTSYTFYVTASNAAGTGPNSATVSATPQAVPSAPTGLGATAGNAQVALTWTASTGASTYQVYYGTNSTGTYTEATSNDTNTSYTVTGLTNNTKYYFYVTASNSYGSSPASSIVNATPALPAKPGTPAGLAATLGNGQALLTWTADTGAASYTVYRGTSSSATTTVVASGITQNAYVVTGLTNGTTYYFGITATNAGGTSSKTSTSVHAAPSASAPSAPTNAKASAILNNSLVITWTDSTSGSPTGYYVYYGPVGTSTAAGTYTLSSETSSTATSLTLTGLTAGDQYWFWVSAVNSTGRTSTAQFFSAPAGLTATAGNTQVVLNWTAAAGAATYNVYQGTAAAGESSNAIATGLTGSTYTVTALTNNKTYWFTVAAVNSSATSGYSNEVNATPGFGTPAAITVPNFSFELDTPGWTYPADWNYAQSSGSNTIDQNVSNTAISGITGSNYFDPQVENTASGTGWMTLTSSASLGTFAANSLYTLTVALGSPVDAYIADKAVGFNILANGTSVATYVAPNSGTGALLEGTGLSDYSVSYSTVSNPSVVGENITVQLTYSFTYTAATSGDPAYFDNIRLTQAAPLAAPSAPTGLTATAGTGQVTLNWTAASGAASYNVYEGTNGSGSEGTTAVQTGIAGTSVTVTGLTNGATYYFEVAAVNSYGTSAMSNEAQVTIGPPSAPTGLTATAGNAQVALSWTATANTTSYQVWYETTTGGTYVEATSSDATNSYTVTGLTNGVSYTFYVTASNGAGTSSASSTVSATPILPAVPIQVTGLTATAGGASVALSWTAVSGATSYNVYQSTTSGGEGSTPVATGISGTTYSATGLINGTTYYFEVAGVDSGGTGPVSSEASATPEASLGIPAAPVLTAMAGDMQVSLSWPAVAGASTYNVYQSTTSGGEGSTPIQTGITTAGYTVTGLTNGTPYYFEATATNSVGTSALSNQATATPVLPTGGTNGPASFNIFPQVVAAHPVNAGFNMQPASDANITENAWLIDGGFSSNDERISLTADTAGSATTFIDQNTYGGTGFYQSIASGFYNGATARTYRYTAGAWSLLRTDTITDYEAPPGTSAPTAANSTITFANSGPVTEPGDIIWIDLDNQATVPQLSSLDTRLDQYGYCPTWASINSSGGQQGCQTTTSGTWPITLSSNVPSSDAGNLSALITAPAAGSGGIWQYIQGAFVGSSYEQMQPGHTYKYDVWLMTGGGTNGNVTVQINGVSGTSHTFSGVNGTWQEFTYSFPAPAALPAGASQPWIELSFTATSAGATLYVDNFQLYDAAWAPNTVSPTAMAAWQAYKPGAVRIWSNFGNSSENYSFWSLNSWLTPDIKSRNTAGIGNVYELSQELEHLPNALANVKEIGNGASPWLIVNMALSEVEWGELIDYLAAPAGTGYASMRPSSHPGPYTADFNTIYLEVGNEEWGTQQVPADAAYGQWAHFVLSNAIAGKSYFSSSKIKFIANGFDLNPGFGSAAAAAAPEISVVDAALYSSGSSSLSGDSYYQSDLVQLPVTNGPIISAIAAQQQLDAASGLNYTLAAYEEGSGASSTGDDTLAAAIGAIDVYLFAEQNGFGPQNVYLYSLGTGPYTTHTNFANGFRPHPQWEAYQMRNNYTSGPIVLTTTNSVPTYSNATITGGAAVPLIAVYTFADANVPYQADVVVISRDLNNSTPVTLNFPATPTGTANLYTLTGDPRASNDAAMTIPIGSTAVSVTANYTFTMPPGSMYIFQVPMTGPWSNNGIPTPPAPASLSANAGNGEVTLTWPSSSGATGYTILRGTVNNGPYTQVGTSTTVTYTDSAVTNGTTYYYVVEATNGGGASPNSPQASATPNVEDGPMATTPPPMDGSNTGAWANVPSVPLSHDFNTYTPDTAWYKLLWDSNYLYVLVSVQDSTLVAPTSANIWTGDSVEVYFSGTDTKSTTYGPTDFQYAFGYGGGVDNESKHAPASLTNVVYNSLNITGGYQLAIKLPWTTLGTTPVLNQQYGFDVMINDATVQGTRIGKLAWWGTLDGTWNNPSLMGPLVLSAPIIQSQSINFTAPASPVTYGVAPITLSATASSNLAVTFSLDPSSTAGAATLSGNQLTITGVGTVVVDANQAGNSSYSAAAQVQQSIVVQPASVNITASSPSVIYGSAVPPITPSFGAFQNGQNSSVLTTQPTCVTAYTVTSNAGSSPSTSCSGAAATNYTFTYTNGSVTVGQASVNITASSPTVTYGAAVPTITPSFSAFQNGQSSSVLTAQPICITAYTVTSNAGSSPSTSCSGAAAANYSFTYTNGSVTVGQASVNITASSPSVIYGAAVPVITPSFGAFQNGQTSAVLTSQPICVTAYTVTSNAGSSPSTSCSGAAAANYTFTYTNGSVTISPAPLTVTANNASMAVGAALPTFTASYSGFQNGQSASVLSGSPSLTTTATNSSPAGTYPITAALGTLSAQNYAFTTFVNGTLSIVASPTVVITTSATLSGSHSNGYTATITITNSGTGAASNVVLSTATLGSVSGTPLPQSIASIPAGGFANFTVSFSGTAGADGAGVAEKYSGTYTGGSFSASVRSVTLP